jgi:predicted phage baseplate assembly protein
MAALIRRVGTHDSFLETMRSRLSGPHALAALTARRTDDFSIALLDAWAVVADILTFYQDRLANEGYLRTATEAISILELGRLVGYTPRPALGASCYLAYSLDPGTQALIPAGSQVKNVSSDGSAPQTFETTEDLIARNEWSSLTPRRTGVALAGGAQDALQVDGLTLEGATVNIKAGDRVLMLFGSDDPVSRIVAGARADFTAGVTTVDLVASIDEGGPVAQAGSTLVHVVADAIGQGPQSLSSQAFSALLTTWQHDPPAQSADIAIQIRQLLEQVAVVRAHAVADIRKWLDRYFDTILAAARELEAALIVSERVVAPEISDATTAAALALCPDSAVSGEERRQPDGDCERGAALAALTPILPALRKAPALPPVNARALAPTPGQDFAADSDVGAKLLAAADPRLASVLYQAWGHAQITAPSPAADVQVMRVKARHDAPVSTSPGLEEAAGTTDTIALDAVYDALLPGSWVIIEGGGSTTYAQIMSTSQSTAPVGSTGLNVPVTELELSVNTLNANTDYVLWGAGDSLHLLGDPITDPVAGAEIELDRVYDGLSTGRWLIVAGERTDVPFTSGVPGVELTMIGGVRQRVDPTTPGESVRTTLELATPLSYAYRRDTITIHGNVVAATQGDTRTEVLGSGDGSVAGQSFPLRQVDALHPLTALPADTPLGFERTETVSVNGVAWHETDVLALDGPTSHDYAVQTPVGSASVSFGDGVYGARLPTGLQNVTARYRVGAGAEGNIAAGQLTELASRPLGVSGVTNPIAATGGSRGDGPNDARGVTPLRMLALDRLVSDSDYENFTQARAGIGKASARRLSDGISEVVHVTIAGVDDVPIDPTSNLVTALRASLADLGDPPLPVMVAVRDLVRIVLAAGVHVAVDYSWDLVEPAVRAAALDALGFARQQLGQPAFLSTAIAAIQAVPGVDYVDVDVFTGVSADASPLDLIVLADELDSADPCVPARLAEWRTTSYSAVPGDTLSSVAAANGLTLDQLVALNPQLTDNDVAGLTLTVFRGFVPAQLAVLSPDLPETLRLRRIP